MISSETELETQAKEFFDRWPSLNACDMGNLLQDFGTMSLSLNREEPYAEYASAFLNPRTERRLDDSHLRDAMQFCEARGHGIRFNVNSLSPAGTASQLGSAGFHRELETRGVIQVFSKSPSVKMADSHALREQAVMNQNERREFEQCYAKGFSRTITEAMDECKGYFSPSTLAQKFNYVYYTQQVDALVGLSAFSIFPEFPCLAYGSALAVDPSFRRKGIAKSILQLRALRMLEAGAHAYITLAIKQTLFPILIRAGAREIFEHDIYLWHPRKKA